MRNVNGFYIKLNFTDEPKIISSELDSFSCTINKEENLAVFVQAGIRSQESAKSILNNYKLNSIEHKPSRYTEGSFLIIDIKNKKIIAGRDRSQAYHLYVYKSKKHLYISTDLSYFLKNECKELDAAAIDLFVNHGVVLAPFPLIKGVTALLPGHCITYKNINAQPIEQIFWKIEKVDIPSKYNDAVQKYGELFLQSIQSNLSGDTNAVFLSGGSDSAAVMGALYKLNVKNVYATHMAIDGNFEFEREDVKLLQDVYKFNLHYITPDVLNKNWKEYVKESLIEGSLNSLYISYPTYQLMGEKLKSLVPPGTTVFNGEMCILDQGFNEASDKTRKFRRWIYMNKGRVLSKSFKVWPENKDVNWAKVRKSYLDRSSYKDKFNVLRTTAQTFLHAIGRPADYYGGLKLGFRGMPGIWHGISLLPQEYKVNIRKTAKDSFFDYFDQSLRSEDWRQSIATLSTLWYSETSNFTMPLDTAFVGSLNMCFPFSSVDLMDFAASLPLEWTIDKKIQKDMCYQYLDMPFQVAYRMKNHKQKFCYFDAVFSNLKDEMINTVLDTDFGPLNAGIEILYQTDKLSDNKLISLYGLSLFKTKYDLTIK